MVELSQISNTIIADVDARLNSIENAETAREKLQLEKKAAQTNSSVHAVIDQLNSTINLQGKRIQALETLCSDH
jgi:hypothetical protein